MSTPIKRLINHKRYVRKRVGLFVIWLSGTIFLTSLAVVVVSGAYCVSSCIVKYRQGAFDIRNVSYTSEEHNALSDVYVSKRAADTLEEALNNADNVLLNNFYKDGGYVVLSSVDKVQKERDKQFEDSVFEDTIYNDNVTVGYISYAFYDDGSYKDLHIVVTDGLDTIEKTLNHELGHYLDSKLLNVSLVDTEFDKLCTVHKSCLNYDDYFDQKEELFAELYADYRLNPQNLKAKCPSAYNYMRTLHQQYK